MNRSDHPAESRKFRSERRKLIDFSNRLGASLARLGNRSPRIFVLIVVFGIAGVIILWRGYQSRNEFKYQGRPFPAWFTQLPLTLVSSQQVMHTESITGMGQQYGGTGNVARVFAALDSFGTNAIPYLLQKLQEEDSTIEEQATRLAVNSGVRSIPFRLAKFERSQAVSGLIRLRDLPRDTIEALARMSISARPDVAEAASYILRARTNGMMMPSGDW